jgi:hypothetical protein
VARVKTGVLGVCPSFRNVSSTSRGELPWPFPTSSGAERLRRRERRADTVAAMQAWVVVGAGSVHWLAGEPGSAWSSARSTRSTPQGRSSPTLSCWQRCSAAYVNGQPRIAFYR